MNIFLILASLFFLGSVTGWIIELLFRNIRNRRNKWINPGFCAGPYLPIYGFCLCVLYLLASVEEYLTVTDPLRNKLTLFVIMAVSITLIEYAAGIFCLKILKVRLWDYSQKWGNVQGIICPQFSAAWAVLSAVYYFLIHPYILDGLNWLSENLAFSFFIGVFFGVFMIDVLHSSQLIVKLKRFAEENAVILKFEGIKVHIRNVQEKSSAKYHFFLPFNSAHPLVEHLKDFAAHMEKQRKRGK